jgi:S1-C subfamily serine protease
MADGNSIPGSLLRIDTENDLALLKAEIKGAVVPLKLPSAAPALALGSKVIALGHSSHAEWVATVGNVSAVNVAVSGFGGPKIAIDARVHPGFSGAPVLNAQGLLVGIVQGASTDGNLTFLIPSSTVTAAFPDKF